MPRKATTEQTKSRGTRSNARATRQASTSVRFAEDDEISDASSEQASEEKLLQDMMAKYQKNVKKNASSHSASFYVQKEAICDKDRKRRQDSCRKGLEMLKDARQRMQEWKEQEFKASEEETKLDLLLERETGNYDAYCNSYAVVPDELAPTRGKVIDDASRVVLSTDPERKKSLHKLKLRAEAKLFQGIEEEKVATDATAMIRCFKGLAGS